jgi:hypothetical protein
MSPSPLLFSSSRIGLDAPVSASPGGAGGGIVRVVPAGNQPWLFSHFAVGAYTSPLGIGIGAATSISRRTNLRVAGNIFNYNLKDTEDGVTYTGSLTFRSIQATLDWFPWHGSFHLSPGLLFYNQNQVIAHGGVPAGDSFTLNNVTYYSGSAQPVSGSGQVNFRRTAPMLTLGWGNWIPRHEMKHLSFPFEIGFAYTGDPTIALNFSGVVCDTAQDANCRPISSDPTVQQNINDETRKIKNDLDFIRFFPIISGGVVYKF